MKSLWQMTFLHVKVIVGSFFYIKSSSLKTYIRHMTDDSSTSLMLLIYKEFITDVFLYEKIITIDFNTNKADRLQVFYTKSLGQMTFLQIQLTVTDIYIGKAHFRWFLYDKLIIDDISLWKAYHWRVSFL